jgi:hypothetical protein
LIWSDAATSKSITAFVRSKDGTQVAVKLAIDIESHPPVYKKFKKQVVMAEPRLCGLAALRSRCLLAGQDLFPDPQVHDGEYYGLHCYLSSQYQYWHFIYLDSLPQMS